MVTKETAHLNILDYFVSLKRHGRIGSTYLFIGHDLLDFSLGIARLINCEGSDSWCGRCEVCRSFEREVTGDCRIIDEDSSIKIATIRDAQQFLSTKASFLNRKILVINQAHMMTEEAAHAFLKTLEEPPRGTVIILTSSRLDMLFGTIISRCRRIYFSQCFGTYTYNDRAALEDFIYRGDLKLTDRTSSARLLNDLIVFIRDAHIWTLCGDKNHLLSPDSYEIILPLKTIPGDWAGKLDKIIRVYDDLKNINLSLAAQLVKETFALSSC